MRLLLAVLGGAAALFAQVQRTTDAQVIESRHEIEKKLQAIAIVERKIMVPMRDGKRMAADVYRPKDESKKYPAIFVRTPYNFNFWDVKLGAPRDMTQELEAVKRGYVFVEMNERGHFFSEGNYDILGAPLSDGWDAIDWISKRPWSSGKVGTIGCSSTAEWQMAVAAMGHPAFTTMVPQGFGAGVGRVGEYYEQGNWYRGGAFQMLFAAWIYGQQNQVRPMFPPNTSQQDLIRASRMFDLAPQMPPVDWAKGLAHLPVMDIIKAADGPDGIYADRMEVSTGGAMIKRDPNDPAWYRGGLWHDDQKIDIPGFWFMSWYDVSVAPNLAAYNHVRKTARPDVANRQYAIIAPTLHCAYKRSKEDTIVGERSMADARLKYEDLEYAWFDYQLKGTGDKEIKEWPKVRYFTMGSNQWHASETWPPAEAKPMTLYLSSGGKANSVTGDGALVTAAPTADRPDTFVYDPMNPVPSLGGNVCCTGNAVSGGSYDQRRNEARADVLVYTSDPFPDGIEVTGTLDVTLYVSSSAKDTDFTVKLVDVYPDGRAYNLDETIQRMRFRNGYDKPLAWMEKGQVYPVKLAGLTTSNWFGKGHRIRIEVSSSNFPRFDRNLNTGGRNWDESTAVIANNSVHHGGPYGSRVVLPIVKR